MKRRIYLGLALAVLTLAAGAGLSGCGSNVRGILNVSYDPTREFYEEINEQFIEHWKSTTGESIDVSPSHGGSGKQARSVIDGNDADVVTLALAYDIDMIAEKSGRVPKDWQKLLPHNSCPYTSTIVFLVRKGNPKQIQDWGDLAKEGIGVITPNPKTSGGARWNYLAAWAWASGQFAGDEAKITEYMGKVFGNVLVLDAGARASTTTFAQREIGDVLLSWENEAYLAIKQFGEGKLEIVTPSMSILAEPPVAVVSGYADAHGTADLAKAYLEFLYTPTGQKLAAKHHFRPVSPEMADPVDLGKFARLKLVTVDEAFGGWAAAQKRHFDDGGLFDTIYKPKPQ